MDRHTSRSSAQGPAYRTRCIASWSVLAVFAVGAYSACSSAPGSVLFADSDGGTTSSGGSPSGGYQAGSTGSSGSGITSSSSTGSPTTSSSSGSNSSSSGTGSGAAITCPPPAANSATLPFAIDSVPGFVASGYLGDYASVKEAADKTCGGHRAPASPLLGSCHTFTYSPGSEGGVGWAGVVWQYPVNNWGAKPGFLIPPGATKVTFWVRGETGMEIISFSVGIGYQSLPTAADPCEDTVTGKLAAMTLPTTWTQVTIPLTGTTTPVTYGGGVLGGFSWIAGGAGQSVTQDTTFYIDDIEWTM